VKSTSFGWLPLVVKIHLASQLHYDLRLEYGGRLISWALVAASFSNSMRIWPAVRMQDHDVKYGLSERAIVSGEGVGITLIWDYGRWQPIGDVSESLRRGYLKFRVQGIRLKGIFLLKRVEISNKWELSKLEDDSVEYHLPRERHITVKSEADFVPFLAKNFPRIWRTTPPPADTAGRRLLRQIIEQALTLIKQRSEQEWQLFQN